MLAGAASVSFAQDAQQQAAAPRPRGMAALMERITLTAEQQTKIDVITKKYADQRDAMRAELQNADQDARRAKMREVMTKQSDEIKVVLTDDQKKVFEKNLADMQARMQQGGGQRPPQG
jgi:Spy/CpxP family protein refolding chaperone